MKAIVLGLVIVAGCVPMAQPSSFRAPSSSAPAGAPPPPPPPEAAGGGLSCMGIFDCFRGCQDGPCIQGCLGQGDPEAQAAASAMMQCGSERCAGAGDDCLPARCNAELEACTGATGFVAEGAAPYQPTDEQMLPGQPHPTANILPWLVGAWIGTNHQFEFFDDGRVRRSSATPMYTDKGTYGCVSLINELGTVVQEGDLLIMRFEPAVQDHCGSKDRGPALTVRYRITWQQYSDGPVMLQLDDIDCTAGPMWCNDRMRRR